LSLATCHSSLVITASFVSQCYHRIHFRCPSGGKVASEQSHDGEEQTDNNVGLQIGCAGAEEQTANETRSGTGEPKNQPSDGQHKTMPEDKPQHVNPAEWWDGKWIKDHVLDRISGGSQPQKAN